MRSTIKIIVILSLFIMITTVLCQPPPPPPAIILPPPQPNIQLMFDFYKLTLQWPNTLCHTSPCRAVIPNFFTIHGLWPSAVNGQPVNIGCYSNTPIAHGNLQAVDVRPIQNELDLYWPDLTIRANNFDFWKYQWYKHGQCSAYPSRPLQYFQLNLGLYHLYNPTLLLSNRGISPGKTTTPADVIQTLFYAIGAYVEVRCSYNYNARMNELWEISICISPQNSLINCTDPTGKIGFASGSCQGKEQSSIYFP